MEFGKRKTLISADESKYRDFVDISRAFADGKMDSEEFRAHLTLLKFQLKASDLKLSERQLGAVSELLYLCDAIHLVDVSELRALAKIEVGVLDSGDGK